MKKLNSLFVITIFTVIMRLFTSCNGNASFSPNELKFAKPFTKTNIVEYRSSRGQIDTIIFHSAIIDTVRIRSIEQGFYNDNILRVSYDLTDNSYHKLTVKSVNGEPTYFISFAKAKNSHSTKEISFLGLLFDDDYLNKVVTTKETSIVFSQDNARYKGVNVNEGIKSFKFDFEKGVVSFVDKNDIEWLRSN